MKTACFIPIKTYSERVKGKNFRCLNGRKLYEYVIQNAMEAQVFDDIFIDTDSDEIKQYAREKGLQVIDRIPELAANTANGNDLLLYQAELKPGYDYYFQMFATAPFLKPESIRQCSLRLVNSANFDCCFTAVPLKGFFWFNDLPINYRPDIMPRSQDLKPLMEESVGLYGITRESLFKYRCRVGHSPYIHTIDKTEAIDIDTEEDMLIAEAIAQIKLNYGK